MRWAHGRKEPAMPRESPTTRTLKRCRENGWYAEVVEYWNCFASRRIDLFGFADVAVITDEHLLLIQCTTRDHGPERFRKITEERGNVARRLLAVGVRIEVWGWRKLKTDGWQPKIQAVTLDDWPRF